MQSPIPFVIYDEQKSQFSVSDEACKHLHALKAPIGVISITGMSRTGKSYILNQMADGLKGFKVGSSIGN